MLVVGFPAAAFSTNCWVLAPAAGAECVVVDPGFGVETTLAEVLAEHRLKPVAVVATHGHADHVMSVTPVCGDNGIAAYIHGDDRYRLADPFASLDPGLRAMLTSQFGELTWTEPTEVRTLVDGATLDLAGIGFRVLHAPGHTEGSTMFVVDAATSDDEPLLVSGDVLFAGSIGRTDLVGGSSAAMVESLATKVLPQPDETVVLPGHGPTTTIGAERAANPYLQGLAPGAGPARAAGRRAEHPGF